MEEQTIAGEAKKQDCERKAFRRLAAKIKGSFRNTPITIVVDGLYACGPILQICNQYHWGFMINLKPKAMPAVWEDALGPMLLKKENHLRVQWGGSAKEGGHIQDYLWSNGIEYRYRDSHAVFRFLKLNVVICYETWTEVHSRSTGETEHCETRYAWLFSAPLKRSNVFYRCTKMGRYRWKIENGILKEKHQGYHYEHSYSYTWEAMEGYHYLMKIAHLLNTLAANSELLHDRVEALGIRGFFHKLWIICNTTFLDLERVHEAAASLGQWRLVPAG